MVLLAANVSLPVRRLALGVTFGDFMSEHVASVVEHVWPDDQEVPRFLPFAWKYCCRGIIHLYSKHFHKNLIVLQPFLMI